MPWELSRMQHLLRLAICACSISSEESNNSRASRNLMILEFRSQVLDFIAMNPPRMGVNWKCTMDVAIRLANLLAARDIFLSLDKGGTILDSGFTEIFSSSIMDHVLHILSFPEWSANLTSNHYLSNIAGLSVALAYLRPEQTSALNDASRSNESLSNAWWNNACWNNTNSNTQNPDKSVFEHNPFQDRRLIKALKRSRKLPLSDDLWKNCLFLCIQEMCREIHSQFLNDGGNFENSTSYHRLSAEMATFGLAALIGCCRRTSVSDTIRQNLNQAASKLMKTAIFTHCISLDNGTVPLIGDDDSGRFLPFTPIGTILSRKEAGKKYLNLSNQSSHSYETIMPDSDMNPNSSPLSNYHIIPYWDENFADHSALPAAVHGLFAPQSGIESVPASTAADFTLKALEKYSEKCPLEFMIVSSLANGNANPANGNSGIVNCNSDIAEFEMSKYIIPISLNPVPSSNAAENNHLSIPAQTAMDSQTEQKSLPGKNSETTHVPMSHIEPGISWSGWLFPDWGLIKLSNGIHTLYLNNSGFGQRGNCGHSHSDKLSILLFRDCRPLMIDPGTYLYTPLPTVREFFRSSAVHSQGIPAWSIKEILLCEQIKWKNGLPGLFSAQNTVHINPFAIHENSIVMSINSEKSELRRQIIFTCKGLEIVDSIKLLNRSPEQEDTTMKQSRTALKQCCTTMSQNDTTLKFDERNMPQWLIDSLVSENHSMILRKEKTPLEPLFSESYGRVSIHRQNPDFQKTDFQEN
ncbi:MAG: hypothetical protein CVV64_15465 [Candidatus Wallbacteria bacterium HGW-Wallbacteria-1]|uniref:Heparinase II/III-like C-terminal domain-containing protein n=1 Tax=Candidatus Wallbacteria bacterium HGW-Wallbacteria-1 TaxID=2013854 RepID=A0A2N1PLK2_9BACT|nr:MAG: hypothetical protein CVV64_15465 [Candidatus Wallbacteria bacterium HGW-Wallbacteria-1]